MKLPQSRRYLATLIGVSCGMTSFLSAAQTSTTPSTEPAPQVQNQAESKASGDTMVVTAAEQTRQAPGVSVITAEDISKRPPANDLSELIRTMPGVNLSGNSTSGSRGNNRQIDIRGMGPENTLILVDGKPVSSRSAVRYGWRGERDTRGDTNWVPSNMVERVEVLRGPAAARYGNGAAGGVVNIITKQPTNEWHGAWNSYMNFPSHKAEGATKRTDFNLMGGLTDTLSMRLYGNYSKTQADAWNINDGHQMSSSAAIPAGREGVRNKDINGLLRWEFMPQQTLEFEMGASRQGNIYAGDTENNNGKSDTQSLYGRETNRMYRQNYALTHRGYWDSGVSVLSYLQYEKTQNTRISEALSGGPAGRPTGSTYTTINLDTYTAHSEVNIPFDAWFNQTATVGVEWVEQKMHDPSSNTQTTTEAGSISTISNTNRSSDISSRIASVFVEDNIELTDSTMLTPALRLDQHSIVGTNWSPSLNLSQHLNDDFTLKMGIAQAYKAPNLYQLNPNYLLYSRGNGCYGGGACYLMGNDDLKAETSINKEIGIEFKHEGYQAGVTYFRNDYRNKIESGITKVGNAVGGSNSSYANANIYQWDNVPKALVEGLEGSLNVPVTETVNWSNNITWILRSENKTTGDYLSITPEFTLNSTVSWQTTEDLSFQGSMTWYGRQKPKKYNYQGVAVASIPLTAGYDTHEVSPYTIFGLSSTYKVNKNLSITGGVDNLFDKRQFRSGNAQSLTTTSSSGVTSITSYGAGAATYNEPGRTFFVSVNTSF
ncbi:TonB-dependent siderophore receptor [Pectobacterium aroidearum]|uniref:TonB-dependent siderophore receptor n=1 Tax=Pectobacterium aroidearum TaxID=1201031 RepID=A0ABR5ZCF6_9GAMM|nr:MULTISPECIES: TonB-dependent siderophore receptor [Pectobacterium]MBA5199471.1 TonB-dependent siderophore receptor [Pectobacterium aroidearum]MBA5227824.1 TonB-dependent siderophore receptor [Pectobacterium aroidearum]MBA5232263.1 TonB-dependent siderophore receptor [Pectobacterium aroidearum]MBA5737427.1 TonB-dependent siderophore receptor [Pectobacterium aroidearum]UXJ99648.1 TonB-dependent siderophore receptor [Pectobacterium aroidearum]